MGLPSKGRLQLGLTFDRLSTKVAVVQIVVDKIDPADGFPSVLALRALADQLESELVDTALGLGWSWALIGEALNVSRQAVQKKHGPRIRGPID